MATFTVTIPNEILDRVLDGYAYQHGYQDELEQPDGSTISNPETKIAFTKQLLKRHIKRALMSWEARQAEEAARQSAIDDVEANINVEVS